MALLSQLVAYADRCLQVKRFDDYCPNGLQVEGKSEVARMVSGVTASQQLIDRAIACKADALLVHHGYFWRGEDACITGIKRARISRLLSHGISLVAYHLPLDQHPVYGNNAQFAQRMGWSLDEDLVQQSKASGQLPLVCTASLSSSITGGELAEQLQTVLQRAPLHIGSDRKVSRVGWCTGAAQGYLGLAVAQGVDAFVSGEISEQTVHEAREYGIHYFAAGHHATERYGVQALGEHLAQQFGIEHQFIDCDNPV